ncbi:hypothetical protein EIN_022700 [Entamoeba invadens IP1]|uniref:hypothetical protein n=1 Tax=Entamoeba invadens IP1 TaxID=370355 RepID=UPI0002C3F3F3|nr:hypothetical protein EIN_022700 [Entamoeba invadens IP1]ELP90641.1 hypothetical protein EIN_022700 [Entamoeba invadens IP1]|eukprot:XP_004257412.1 hypothetical protein EIN_022700 [Entamoeba invadens IP1]
MGFLEFIQRHTFTLYLLPVLCFCVMTGESYGYDTCIADRLLDKKTSIWKYVNPQTLSVATCFLVVLFASVRYNKRITIMCTPILDFLNSFVFHRYMYFILCIMKKPMNDANCTVVADKYNSISGHYMTLLFTFVVLIRLIKTTSIQPNTNFHSISFKNTSVADQGSTIKGPFGEKCSIWSYNTMSTQFVLSVGTLFCFVCISYVCMVDTLRLGYHTARQALYGIVFGIVVIYIYYFLTQLKPFFFSFVNLILFTICYLCFSLFYNRHVHFDFYVGLAVFNLLFGIIRESAKADLNEFDE